MCLTFFGFTNNNTFFLIFNRDEFLSRETLPLNKYEYNNDIYYSKDIITQGTFCAINIKFGNFCFLLNHSNQYLPFNPEAKLKRGLLPLEFCEIEMDLKEEDYSSHNDKFAKFFSELEQRKEGYNGFNLVCGNLLSKLVYYYSNNTGYLTENKIDKTLPILLNSKDTVYGVGNYSIFQEVNKISLGVHAITNLLESGECEDNELFSLMRKNNLLGDNINFTDIDFNSIIKAKSSNENSNNEEIIIDFRGDSSFKEQYVSSIFVNDNILNGKYFTEYGTRQCILMKYTYNDSKLIVKEKFGEILALPGNTLYLNTNEFFDDEKHNSFAFTVPNAVYNNN